jgi:hypothetical protein
MPIPIGHCSCLFVASPLHTNILIYISFKIWLQTLELESDSWKIQVALVNCFLCLYAFIIVEGRHSSRTDGCKPCESACKVSALSSHWTCIAIWFTFCAENLHRYQSMWKIYLSFIQAFITNVLVNAKASSMKVFLHTFPNVINW